MTAHTHSAQSTVAQQPPGATAPPLYEPAEGYDASLTIKKWEGRNVQKQPALTRPPSFAPTGATAAVTSSSSGDCPSVPSTIPTDLAAITEPLLPPQIDQNVKTVSVEGREFTDDDARELVSNYPNLTEVILIDCDITDGVFTILAQLTQLKSMTLGKCRISDKGLSCFLMLPQLSRLVITGPTFDDQKLRYLLALPGLKQLEFSKCENITASKLKLITEFAQKLEILVFRSMRISDQVLEATTKAENLTTLSLTSCSGFTEEGFQHIGAIRGLVKLSVIKCPNVTDNCIAKLGKSGALKLEYLNLSGSTQLTYRAIKTCVPFPKLQTLVVSHCTALDDNALYEIAKMLGLKHLDTSFCSKITDKGLGYLSANTALESVQLNDCHQISKLTPLAKLIRLRYLILRNCEKIKNNELLHLIPCIELHSLDLSFCPEITALGLQPLIAPLQKIKRLFLNHCPNLTREGMEVFETFTQLTLLSLQKCFDQPQERREFMLEMRNKASTVAVEM